jgi:hypothetical protein
MARQAIASIELLAGGGCGGLAFVRVLHCFGGIGSIVELCVYAREQRGGEKNRGCDENTETGK